jgi:hypothetical protein
MRVREGVSLRVRVWKFPYIHILLGLLLVGCWAKIRIDAGLRRIGDGGQCIVPVLVTPDGGNFVPD